jgi:protein-tyrosine phosphatase
VIADIGGPPVQGGGTVRRGLVFRMAGALAAQSLAPLSELAPRIYVDLRGDGEDRSVVETWARTHDAEYVHAPINAASGRQIMEAIRAGASEDEADDYLRRVYRTIVDDHGPQLAATVGAIATSAAPAAFGCAAGKDRTGVVTGLLHSVLGVDDDEVVRRFVAQAPPVGRLRTIARGYLQLGPDVALPAAADVLLGVTPQRMSETLEHVRAAHGSVASYLEAHGLEQGAIEALRARLVAAR